MSNPFLVKQGNIEISYENNDTYRTFYEVHQPHFPGDYEHRNWQMQDNYGNQMSQHIPTATPENMNLIQDITLNAFKIK